MLLSLGALMYWSPVRALSETFSSSSFVIRGYRPAVSEDTILVLRTVIWLYSHQHTGINSNGLRAGHALAMVVLSVGCVLKCKQISILPVERLFFFLQSKTPRHLQENGTMHFLQDTFFFLKLLITWYSILKISVHCAKNQWDKDQKSASDSCEHTPFIS